MRTLLITLLSCSILLFAGCRSQAGDPQCVLDGGADAVRSANEVKQTQAHVVPSVGVSKEGDVFVAPVRLGVDVQGAATGAPNPLTIESIAGGGAAARLLKTQTPEEKGLMVRLARTQKALGLANEDLSIAAPENKPAIGARIAQLEGQESLTLSRLQEIYVTKLEQAAGLVPDLSALESVVYNVFQNNAITSGKAMTDTQSTVTADAMKEFIKRTQANQPTSAAATGGGS